MKNALLSLFILLSITSSHTSAWDETQELVIQEKQEQLLELQGELNELKLLFDVEDNKHYIEVGYSSFELIAGGLALVFLNKVTVENVTNISRKKAIQNLLKLTTFVLVSDSMIRIFIQDRSELKKLLKLIYQKEEEIKLESDTLDYLLNF